MFWGRIFFLEHFGVFQQGVGLAEGWLSQPDRFYFICKLSFAVWNMQASNYPMERDSRDREKVTVSLAKQNAPAKPGCTTRGGNNPNCTPCPRAAAHLPGPPEPT